MRVLSLFSGIGGFELGLQKAGLDFELIGFAETDPYAAKVLAARFPEVVNLGDVRGVNVTDADLIVAGFPCQDLSIANVKRQGLAGARSGLVREFVRLREANPNAHFIVENVASMGALYEETISTLLGCKPTFIDSASLGPAHRKRLYWTSFPIPSVQNTTRISDKWWEDILLPLDTVGHLALSDRECAYMNRVTSDRKRDHWAFGHHFDTSDPKAKCLTANLHKGVPYNVIVDRRGDRPSAGDVGILIRKLHPVECERLMGFYDNWTAELSTTRRLRAIGNSVHVGTITHIAGGLR